MPLFLRPAGQFTTTAQDMAIFARFLMGEGKLNGRSFIKPHLLKKMGQSHSTQANQHGLPTDYQYGLSYRDRYGVIGTFHRGTTTGFHATLYLFPAEKKAFFIGFNMDSETADYARFHQIFIQHLGITTPDATPIKPNLPNNIGTFEGWYRLHPLQMPKFAYLDLVFNSVRLSAQSNTLAVDSLQNETYPLLPISGGLFRKTDRVNPSHVLYHDGHTSVFNNGLVRYEKVHPLYLALHWLSLALGLIGLLGVLLRGAYLLTRRQLSLHQHALSLPFFALIGLAIPIPFLLNQSFIELGEITLANVLLAIVTGVLPLAMTIGAIQCVRLHSAKIDTLSIFAALQWCMVLTVFGLLPFTIWT